MEPSGTFGRQSFSFFAQDEEAAASKGNCQICIGLLRLSRLASWQAEVGLSNLSQFDICGFNLRSYAVTAMSNYTEWKLP